MLSEWRSCRARAEQWSGCGGRGTRFRGAWRYPVVGLVSWWEESLVRGRKGQTWSMALSSLMCMLAGEATGVVLAISVAAVLEAGDASRRIISGEDIASRCGQFIS